MRLIEQFWSRFDRAGALGKLGLLAIPLLFFACCGLTLVTLVTPQGADPEPVALPVAQVEPTAGEPEPTTAPAATATVALDPATAEPVPTQELLPTATAVPPTRTRAPTPTPRPPTPTARPTATPLPPTAVPTPTAVPPTATAALDGETATVVDVIDGDTIDVNVNGSIERVRYIGIDTPERGDACGSEATQANAALVAGQTVRMVRDVSERDRFDRLLRYVYLTDGRFVNGELVAGGWAIAREYPPDTAMASVLAGLMARGAGRGCALVVAPLPTAPPPAPAPLPTSPAEQPTAAPQPTAAGNCHPAYPTVCIPPPPPDLDCGDIPHRRFQVLPPDPHNFDGDGNGVGCESG